MLNKKHLEQSKKIYDLLLPRGSSKVNAPKTTIIELVRFFNAMYFYKSSTIRVDDILNDPVYGFFLIRKKLWLSRRDRSLNKILDCEMTSVGFLNEVRDWNPSKYPLKQRLEDLKASGIIFNDEQCIIYKEYLKLAEDEWYNNAKSCDLKTVDILDLWNSVAGKTDLYDDKIGLIKACSKLVHTKSQDLSFDGSSVKEVDQMIDDDAYTSSNDKQHNSFNLINSHDLKFPKEKISELIEKCNQVDEFKEKLNGIEISQKRMEMKLDNINERMQIILEKLNKF